MTEPATTPDAAVPPQATDQATKSAPARKEDSFLIFLLKLVVMVAIFRSLNHIYAQVIDDESGRTLVAASSLEKELGTKLVIIEQCGKRNAR